jgi:hypothetical protein
MEKWESVRMSGVAAGASRLLQTPVTQGDTFTAEGGSGLSLALAGAVVRIKQQPQRRILFRNRPNARYVEDG